MRIKIANVYDVDPLEPCPKCKAKNTKSLSFSFYEDVFFCSDCREYIFDICPLPKEGLYFRRKYSILRNLEYWFAVKCVYSECRCCRKRFMIAPDNFRTYFVCSSCKLRKDLRYYLEENIEFICRCKKRIEPRKVYNVILPTMTARIINGDSLISADETLDDIVKNRKLEYGILDEIRDRFLIVCDKKCVGKYQRVILKRVAKHVWITDRVKLNCFSCGNLEVVPLEALTSSSLKDFRFFCRNCFVTEDTVEIGRRLDYIKDVSIYFYMRKRRKRKFK